MTLSPKEKAEELVNKFISHTRVFHEVLGWEDYIDSAKQCAFIAVDEILQTFNNEWIKLDFWTEEINGTINFWQEVKQEIENL